MDRKQKRGIPVWAICLLGILAAAILGFLSLTIASPTLMGFSPLIGAGISAGVAGVLGRRRGGGNPLSNRERRFAGYRASVDDLRRTVGKLQRDRAEVEAKLQDFTKSSGSIAAGLTKKYRRGGADDPQ